MNTIYTLYGGELIASVLNAITAFVGTNEWNTLIRMGVTTSIIVYVIRYITKRDPTVFFKWILVYFIIMSVFFVPKKTVQIRDLSNPAIVKTVDNVPLGISLIYSTVTSIGYGLAKQYDTFFMRPDSESYSKTGLLFGATLARNSLKPAINNPILRANFNRYISNCVIGDIYLNNKYTITQLMSSDDLIGLITSKPSPIRRMIYTNRNGAEENKSCSDSAKSLNSDLNVLFNSSNGIAGMFNNFYLNTSNKENKNMVLANLLQSSYSFYFQKESKTAGDILKQNIAISAVKDGLKSYAGNNQDTGSLVSLTALSSQQKSRLNWATSAKIATTYLPLLHTVMIIFCIAIFPLVILVTLTDLAGFSPLKNYIYSIIYLMTWLPLFSILNYIMTFYGKTQLGNISPTLSSVDEIELGFSDLGMIAGFMSLSIPYIALTITKGIASGVHQVAGMATSSISSTVSQVSSSASDGNWSMGNISTNNVQGNKWDTNYAHANGRMTNQLDNGSTISRNADGTTTVNTSSSMSQLATTPNLSDAWTTSLQKNLSSTRDSIKNESQALSESSNVAMNNIQQLSNSLNDTKSYSDSKSYETAQSRQQAVNDITSAVESFSRQTGRSYADSFAQLTAYASSHTFNAGFKGGVGTSDKTVIKAEAGVGYQYQKSKTDTDTESSSFTKSTGFDKSNSHALVQQFSDGMSKLTALKRNESDTYSQSDADSYVDSITSSYQDSMNHIKNIEEKEGMMKAYQDAINHTNSNSASVNSNLSSEFVSFVMASNPTNAENILSNTSDSGMREQREELLNEFMDNKINSLNNNFNTHSNAISNKYDEDAKNISNPDASIIIDKNNENKKIMNEEDKPKGITNVSPASLNIQKTENDFNKELNKKAGDNSIGYKNHKNFDLHTKELKYPNQDKYKGNKSKN